MRDDKSIRGTAAKREARELRRAMGVEALSVISDHEDAIATLGAGLHKAQVDVAAVINQAGWAVAQCKDHGAALERNRTNLDIAYTHIADERNAFYNFRHRTFLERLRWLFTGR